MFQIFGNLSIRFGSMHIMHYTGRCQIAFDEGFKRTDSTRYINKVPYCGNIWSIQNQLILIIILSCTCKCVNITS